MSVAADAEQFSALADGLSAVPRMARRRRLGECEQGIARAGTQSARPKSHAHSRYHRFAECQDGTKRGQRGYDAGKKIKGRKRHIAVDTQGNLLAVVVHSAGIQDRVGARAVMMRLFRRFDTITKIFVDGGYTGKLIGWAKDMFGYDVEVVQRNEQHKFVVLPKRWIVERTISWLNWSRRLSKDYELHHTSAETMIYIAFAHQLLRRST
jgi:transposase